MVAPAEELKQVRFVFSVLGVLLAWKRARRVGVRHRSVISEMCASLSRASFPGIPLMESEYIF